MNSNRILSILFFCCSILCTQAQSGWISKARPPFFPGMATVFSIGGYGYVGNGLSERSMRDFLRYDPVSDSWTEIESMPTLGRRGAFSFVVNEKAYVGGGITELMTVDDEFWEYDPAQSKWTRKADLPSKLTYDDSTLKGFSLGSKGYLLSPFSKSNFYVYDPEADTWSKMANYPGQKAGFQICFTYGDKAYVGGGRGIYDYMTEFWEYDASSDQWTRKADVPGQVRMQSVSFSIGEYGYYGMGSYRTKFLHDFWRYNILDDTWIQIDSCVYDAIYPVGLSIGSKGYVGMGWQYSVGSGWWEYDPGTSSVNAIGQKESIKIFPNPTTGLLYIDGEDYVNKGYAIYSLTGKLMKKGMVLGDPIDVNDLPDGFYFLQTQSDHRSVNFKFIKE